MANQNATTAALPNPAGLPRVARYNGIEIAIPDPAATVDQIRRSLAGTFKELANADASVAVEGNGENARQVITFSRVTGTKGLHEGEEPAGATPAVLSGPTPHAVLAADVLALPPLHLAIDTLVGDLLLLPLHADPARERAEAEAIAEAEREIAAVGRVVAAVRQLAPFVPGL